MLHRMRGVFIHKSKFAVTVKVLKDTNPVISPKIQENGANSLRFFNDILSTNKAIKRGLFNLIRTLTSGPCS